MAEVRKRVVEDTYNTGKIKKNLKKNEVKTSKNTKKGNGTKRKNSNEKKSLFVRFRIFCHGVRSEFAKVHWPSKADMLKYSIATIAFIVFCSIFFFIIDVLFAFFQSLFS